MYGLTLSGEFPMSSHMFLARPNHQLALAAQTIAFSLEAALREGRLSGDDLPVGVFSRWREFFRSLLERGNSNPAESNLNEAIAEQAFSDLFPRQHDAFGEDFLARIRNFSGTLAALPRTDAIPPDMRNTLKEMLEFFRSIERAGTVLRIG